MAPRGNGSNSNRGRGRGRGHCASPFKGQSTNWRGQSNSGRGGGCRGRPAYNNLNIIDVDIQRYADDSPASGYASPVPRGRGRGNNRGRGWGRGTNAPLNLQAYSKGHRTPPPPRREDWSNSPTPADRGAGRAPSRGLGARYNLDMPLSKLLALDRPYLRPINFVPAQLTPVLFEREEELIEVHEFKAPEDHVPTAEQVSRVFSQQEPPPIEQDSFFQNTEIDLFVDTDSVPVVTVDFGSLGQLLEDSSDLQPKGTKEHGPEVSEAGQGMNIFDTIMQALSISSTENIDTNLAGTMQEPDNQPDEPSPRYEEITSITTSRETIVKIREPEDEKDDAQGDERPLFVMDANPAQPSVLRENIEYTSTISGSQPLGSMLPGDDDVIVYVASHPRSGRSTSNIPSSTDAPTAAHDPRASGLSAMPGTQLRLSPFSTSRTDQLQASKSAESSSSTIAVASRSKQPFVDMSFSFDAISRAAELNRQQTASPRARRLTKRDRQNRSTQSKGKKRGSFGSLGAMLEERHLHEDELEFNGMQGRREGSDIDWGDSAPNNDGPRRVPDDDQDIERVSNSFGGMSIDSDLDIHAMQRFVNGMSNKGMEHTRIDDIKDVEKLRIEDEESSEPSSGSETVDSEVEAVIEAEEGRLAGEADGSPPTDSESGELEDLSSDDDESPMQSFQARLVQVRQSAKAKGKMKESAFSAAQSPNSDLFGSRMSKLRGRGNRRDEESEDDDSDDFDADFTRAESDEDYLADLQDLLDDDDEILMSDRKQRKALFKSVLNGDFQVAPAKKRRDYGKNLPPELREQWEKDRAKKAESKAKRAAARLQVAADPFAIHKGGKKGRKAMLLATQLAEEEREDLPALDIALLVQQIRMFLGNLSLTSPMALPPMDKGSRKKVHEIADAFGLKSKSTGKGAARYTRLIKTSRSGIQVNERKIQRILRSGGEHGFTRPGGGGKDKSGGGGAPKHKEGDEVGKAAPKIGESNIGFKMLANMGWTEGERIGVSGGLDAPLKAVFKSTKLGLGATH